MRIVQKKYGTSLLIITHDVYCARVISERISPLVVGMNYALGNLHETFYPNGFKNRGFL